MQNFRSWYLMSGSDRRASDLHPCRWCQQPQVTSATDKPANAQPHRAQPVLLIAVSQLALVADAAGPYRTFPSHSRSVKCAGSDHDHRPSPLTSSPGEEVNGVSSPGLLSPSWPESPLPQA